MSAALEQVAIGERFVEGFEAIEPALFIQDERWERSYKAPKLFNGYPVKEQPVPATFKLTLRAGWTEPQRWPQRTVAKINRVKKLIVSMEKAGRSYDVVPSLTVEG